MEITYNAGQCEMDIQKRVEELSGEVQRVADALLRTSPEAQGLLGRLDELQKILAEEKKEAQPESKLENAKSYEEMEKPVKEQEGKK